MANPATRRYVRDVTLPYATDHGIELHELHKVRRDGTVETLHGRLVQPGSRSLPIPVRIRSLMRLRRYRLLAPPVKP